MTFGPGVSINSITRISPTVLIVNITVAQGAAPGLRDITVTTEGIPLLGPGLFTVTASPAQITGIAPNNGRQGQSFAVTITGSNTSFTAGSIVSLGAGITVNSVTVNSATSLTANISIANGAQLGTRDVTVTTGGTSVVGSGLFTVNVAEAQQLLSVTPSTGLQGQTLSVTIAGSNTTFTAGSTASFGAGITVNSVSFVSATSLNANITIATNAAVGPRDVTVTTDGTPLTGSGLFTVTAPPATILTVTPSTGQQGQQGLQVTIIGANTIFSAQSNVSFGSGVTVTALSIGSPTSLTATINIAAGAALGPRDVTITTNGTPVTGSGMFSVTAASPQLISASPSSGPQGQTLAVTILGLNTSFNAGSTVSFGSGISINSVAVNSGTSLTATISIAAGAALGARDVTVTTGGTPLIGPNLFSVVAAGPAILSVNPSSASPGQTLNVKITGALTHFVQGSSQPSFGPGITVNSVTVTNATTLDANITISSNAVPGSRTVSVTTGTETASLENGFLVLGSGQSGPLSCLTNTGVPPLLRAEGFTELTGDIILVCTGGVAGQASTVNVQVFLNTQITSRVVNGQSEALLIVDELGSNAPPGPITPVIYRAVPAQGDNAVVWTNVQVVAPGPTGQRVLRITNVRANATAIGASTSLIPSQVVAFLSVSPSNSLPLSSSQQIVGFVQPGLVFDVTNCDGSASSSSVPTAQFAQCVGENSTGNRDLIGGTEGGMQFAVRFKEGFQTAFKTQIAEGQLASIPGVVFNSESGFVRTPELPYSVGGASSGTRLTARFTNIPSGARLFVTNAPSLGSTPGLSAVLVRTGPNGESGGLQPGVPAAGQGTATLFCPLSAGDGFNASELQVVNGSATAVWEVTAANPAALESAVFGVAVAYAPNTPSSQPGLGQASVSGNFAPFYAPGSDAGRMSSSLPIPRFIDSSSRVSAFRIDSCVTNLLFPFVTNQAGFDTGIAVANTSRDPFGNALRSQSGVCTINYYGGTPQGGAAPASQRSNTAVEAGSTMTFVVSSGGSHGIAATPGFQGYVIVQCDFRYAHGFAFITDGPIGSARVAEGYLGLVMDNGIASRGSQSETLSH